MVHLYVSNFTPVIQTYAPPVDKSDRKTGAEESTFCWYTSDHD
jgi:hypothetical protein